MHVRLFHSVHPQNAQSLWRGWTEKRPADTVSFHHLAGPDFSTQQLESFENSYRGQEIIYGPQFSLPGSSFALGCEVLRRLEKAANSKRPKSPSVTLLLGPDISYDGGVDLLRALLGKKPFVSSESEFSSELDLHKNTLAELFGEICGNDRVRSLLRNLHLAIISPVELFGPEQASWVYAHQTGQDVALAFAREKAVRDQYLTLAENWKQLCPSVLPVISSGEAGGDSVSPYQLPRPLPAVLSGGAGGGGAAVLQLLGVPAQSLAQASARWAQVPSPDTARTGQDARGDSWEHTEIVIVVEKTFSDVSMPFSVTGQVLHWVQRAQIVAPVVGIFESSDLSRRQAATSGLAGVYERSQWPDRNWQTWGQKLATTWGAGLP